MELMPDFILHRPVNIEDALKLMAENDGARYVAGGTDMIVNIRRGIEQPPALIELSSIEELQSITVDDDGIHIGAAVTLDKLSNDKNIIENANAIAEAAAAVAGPTHQSYGTIGGNLCLDTRCLFYNQSEWWRKSNDYCLKERGNVCHVAPGGNRCFASFSGDVAPAALVHNAEVDLLSTDGFRRIKLAQLYKDDGMNHLALRSGELLFSIHLPIKEPNVRSSYEKARIRGSIDFPLAGAAVWLRKTGNVVEEIRIGLTAVNPSPQLLENLDEFNGKTFDDTLLNQIAKAVQSVAKPMRTTTAKPWYRRRVAGTIVRRLAKRLADPLEK